MDDMLTTKEAAKVVGRHEQTLRRWRVEGSGPKYVKVTPRLVMYSRDALDEWNNQHTTKSAYDDHDLVVGGKGE